MKKIILFVFLMAKTLQIFAQEVSEKSEEKPFELGVNLVKTDFANSYPLESNKSHYSFLTGVIFRYHLKNRLSFRFSSNVQKTYWDWEGIFDAPSGHYTGTMFNANIGTQYAPFKKVKWLYGFLDTGYETSKTTGNIHYWWENTTYNEVHWQQNIAISTGFGAKIRIFKSFYLTPEVSYSLHLAHQESTKTSWNTYKTTQYTNDFNYFNGEFRLIASACF